MSNGPDSRGGPRLIPNDLNNVSNEWMIRKMRTIECSGAWWQGDEWLFSYPTMSIGESS